MTIEFPFLAQRMPIPESTLPRFSAVQTAVISLETRAKDSSLEQILRATLDEAEVLTNSCIGFYHFVDEDQENLHLQAWSTRTEAEFCKAEGKGMPYPVSKAGVWADCLRVGHPLIHNDYASLANRRGLPPGHATVLRELVVPVHRSGRIVAILGVGNKATDYDESDVESVHRLADLAWHLAETKRMTSALEESLARNQALIRALPDLIFTNKRDGEFLDVHVPDPSLLLFPPESFLHRKVQDVLPRPLSDQFVRAFEEALDSSSVRELTYSLQVGDGEKQFEARVVPCSTDTVITMVRDITKQQRVEAELREREERYRNLFNNAEVGMFRTRLDGGEILEVNPKCLQILGGTLEDYQHKPSAPLWADSLRRLELVRLLQADGQVSDFEFDLLTLRGEIRHCVTSLKLYRESGILEGSIQDMTGKKQAENALRASEARIRAIWDAEPECVKLVSPEGLLLDMNKAGLDMLEIDSKDQVIGKAVIGMVVPSHRPRFMEIARRTFEEGAGFGEFEIIGLKGTRRWMETHAVPLWDEETQSNLLLAVTRDITERKLAEEAERASEKRFHDIAKVSGDWIWEVDAKFRYTYASGNVLGILGYSAEQVLGKTPFDLMPLDEADRVGAIFAEIASRKEAFRDLDNVNLHRDGSLRHILTNGMPILDSDGNLLGYRGLDKDVTEEKNRDLQRRNLEIHLHQAQKMESLGVLAGGVAHDMNNVLGAILALASTNIEIQPPGSSVYRSFETIVKAATRGGEMVRSLLSFARQHQAEERVLDVNAILKEEIHLLECTTLSKVILELDLEPGLYPILGDSSALTSAFMNLCVNAVDAMAENGTLTLRTQNIDRDWIEVVVEDTGTGMPKEILDHAMEPFFTTKGVGKGTGLGLAMVYSTVKAHRGQIEIQSHPGQGTRVRMRFPACEPKPEPTVSVTGTMSEAPKRSLTVMLVDDDELIQSSMGTVLETLDHAVTVSSSGEEALALIDGGFRPDVVILDMNMPGLGGIGTLPRLRILLPEVPVLLSTGRTDQTALDLSKNHPFVFLLPKPFSIKEIQRHLERLER